MSNCPTWPLEILYKVQVYIYLAYLFYTQDGIHHVVDSHHLETLFGRESWRSVSPPVPTRVGVEGEDKARRSLGIKDHNVVGFGPLIVASVLYIGQTDIVEGLQTSVESNVQLAD